MAWHIQAGVAGGLDTATRRLLDAAGKTKSVRLGEGARISREWHGVVHEVEVASQGYRYQGDTYGSLSEVARLITGVRWNGPRFFGLRAAKASR